MTWKSRLLSLLFSLWAWLFLLLLIIFFEAWSQLAYSSTFIGRIAAIQSILLASTQTLLLALGLTFVIVAAGIDLSIAFITGLAAVSSALTIQLLDPVMAPALALILGILVGLILTCIPGLINGLLVARLAVPSFIGTLGMYGVAEGVAYLISGGTTVPITNPIASAMGNQNFLYIPIPVWITAAITLILYYVLANTKFGLYTYAMGGNPQAAIRAGINVSRHTIYLFILSALTAGIAGIIYTGRFSAGSALAGEPTLLNAVAAVFIGGASLTGGVGTIRGTAIGALIIAVIQFGLVFINVQPFWQFVAVGAVIILAVLVDQYKDRWSRSS